MLAWGAPQSRRQRAGSLTLPEREEISRGLSAGYSFQAIAAFLQRAVSTISREVTKNGGRHAYTRFRSYWGNRGASGMGGWQARRDILE
nr:helix-turn-helix domain-containing protein [Saccharopolyspora erythraea]